MMILTKILSNTSDVEIINNEDISKVIINNIQYDSRKIELNDMFICINGFSVDGHDYLEAAISKGAKVVALTRDIDYSKYPNIIFIKVKDDRKFMAEVAVNFYDNPSKKIKMIGITGTKGKTTTAHIIKNILDKAKIKAGIIGTNGIEYLGKKIESSRTTPESLDLQRILSDMYKHGIEMVVMEASSHALELSRIHGINYEIGAFSNLSREHLGFHKTFDNYFNAKAKLFDISKKAVINIDDEYGEKLFDKLNIPKVSISLKKSSDIRPLKFETNLSGSVIYLDNLQIKTKLVGLFNIYNILLAYGVCASLGIKPEFILDGIKDVAIPGRMEFVSNSKNYNIIVDFAHSVDSLEKVLSTLKEYVTNKLILVFGCGGGGLQDPLKRIMMGEAAAKYADHTIITEDSPREENSMDIAHEVEKGMTPDSSYEIIIDRAKAIQKAIDLYQEGDLILIAGKGHETTQEYQDETVYFSDIETAQKYLEKEIS